MVIWVTQFQVCLWNIHENSGYQMPDNGFSILESPGVFIKNRFLGTYHRSNKSLWVGAQGIHIFNYQVKWLLGSCDWEQPLLTTQLSVNLKKDVQMLRGVNLSCNIQECIHYQYFHYTKRQKALHLIPLLRGGSSQSNCICFRIAYCISFGIFLNLVSSVVYPQPNVLIDINE